MDCILQNIRTIIAIILNDPMSTQIENVHSILQLNTALIIALVSFIYIPYQLSKYKESIEFNNKVFIPIVFLVVYSLLPALVLMNFSSAESIAFKILYITLILSPYLILVLSIFLFYFGYRSIDLSMFIFRIKSRLIEKLSQKQKTSNLFKKYEEDKLVDDLFIQELGELSTHGYSDLEDAERLFRISTQAVENSDMSILLKVNTIYSELIVRKEFTQDIQEFFFEEYIKLIDYVREKRHVGYIEMMIDNFYETVQNSSGHLDTHILNFWLALIVHLSKPQSFVDLKYRKLLSKTKYSIITRTPHNNDLLDRLGYKRLSMIALQFAKSSKGYYLWYWQECLLWICRHYAKNGNLNEFERLCKEYGKIGLISRVYELHCEARNCPKTNYEHVLEGFEILETWKTTFKDNDKKKFLEFLADNISISTGFKHESDNPSKQTKSPKKLNYFSYSIGSKRDNYEIEIDFSKVSISDLDRYIIQHEL